MYLHSFGECVLGNFIVWPKALQDETFRKRISLAGCSLLASLFLFRCMFVFCITAYLCVLLYLVEHFEFKIVGVLLWSSFVQDLEITLVVRVLHVAFNWNSGNQFTMRCTNTYHINSNAIQRDYLWFICTFIKSCIYACVCERV